jgi:PAS domain S-box-containing protein
VDGSSGHSRLDDLKALGARVSQAAGAPSDAVVYRELLEGFALAMEELRLASERLDGLQAALLQPQQQFRAAFGQAPVGIAQSGPETGVLLQVNRQFCEIAGRAEQELVGRSFSEIPRPADRQRNRDGMRVLKREQVREFADQMRFAHLDGADVWVNLLVSLVREAGACVRQTDAHQTLAAAIESVVHDDVHPDPVTARLLLQGYREAAEQVLEPTARLTPRESELLHLLAAGYGSREIGKKLFLARSTTDAFASRLMQRFHLSHRSDLVRIALRTGLRSSRPAHAAAAGPTCTLVGEPVSKPSPQPDPVVPTSRGLPVGYSPIDSFSLTALHGESRPERRS